jgi:hypothetical protein
MRRNERVFLLAYGIAMLALAGTLRFESSDHNGWYAMVSGATASGFVLAALGFQFQKDGEPAPSKRWVMSILLMVVLQWLVLFFDFPSLHFSAAREALWPIASLIPFAAVALAFSRARPRHFHSSGRRWREAALVAAMLGGAMLILLSLLLKTTDGAKGWQILAQRAHWITFEYNVARILAEKLPASWDVSALFAVGGCAMYLLALTVGAAAIAWVVLRRGRVQRLGRSRWLPWLAAGSCFATFYLYNDIFWGWQAVLWDDLWQAVQDTVWHPAAALALWLSAQICVLWMVVVAARKAEILRAVSVLQVAQLPIAGFNVLMIPMYFEREALDIPGLGTLMIGLQLLTWGCLGVLLFAEDELATENRDPKLGRKIAAEI